MIAMRIRIDHALRLIVSLPRDREDNSSDGDFGRCTSFYIPAYDSWLSRSWTADISQSDVMRRWTQSGSMGWDCCDDPKFKSVAVCGAKGRYWTRKKALHGQAALLAPSQVTAKRPPAIRSEMPV